MFNNFVSLLSLFSQNNKDSNTFYIGKKHTPITLTKRDNKIFVKLGSGFASYTLESNKQELEELSNFVKNIIQENS